MRINKLTALAVATAVGAIAPLAAMPAAHADTDAAYVIGKVTDRAGHPLAYAGYDVEFCSTDPADAGGDPADANGCTDVVDTWSASTDRQGRAVVSINQAALRWDLANYPRHKMVVTASYYDNNSDWTGPAGVGIATPVVGANRGGPTIALTEGTFTAPTQGVVLSGVVTDGTGAPVRGAWVTAYNAANGRYISSAAVSPDGHYYFTAGNPSMYTNPAEYAADNVTGAVKLEFSADGRVSTWSGGGLAKSRAAAVPVARYGAAPAHYNGVVGLEGTITGVAKLPAAGRQWQAYATVYDADGTPVSQTGTDAAGNFSIDVAPGRYYVRVDGDRYTQYTPAGASYPQIVDTFGFVAGYYGKKATSLANASTINVGPNGTVSVGAITLTNAYHATEKPRIKAKKGIKKGAKLSVTSGTWNHRANTTYTYAWKVGHKVLSTKSKLKLSKKIWKKRLKNGKKAKKLTVTVTASDRYGEIVNGSVTLKVRKTLAKQDKAGHNGGKGKSKHKGGKGKKHKGKK